MNRADFLTRLGLGFLATLFAREESGDLGLRPRGVSDDEILAWGRSLERFDDLPEMVDDDTVYGTSGTQSIVIHIGPEGQWTDHNGDPVQVSST